MTFEYFLHYYYCNVQFYKPPIDPDNKVAMDESRIIDETDDSVLDDEYASNITEPNERQIGGIGIACSNDKTSSTVEKYVDVTMTPNHFDLVCCIGEGAFGKVLLVRPRLESTVTSRKNVYAMKVISKKLLKKKNHFSYMKAERDIMTKVCSIWLYLYILCYVCILMMPVVTCYRYNILLL